MLIKLPRCRGVTVEVMIVLAGMVRPPVVMKKKVVTNNAIYKGTGGMLVMSTCGMTDNNIPKIIIYSIFGLHSSIFAFYGAPLYEVKGVDLQKLLYLSKEYLLVALYLHKNQSKTSIFPLRHSFLVKKKAPQN